MRKELSLSSLFRALKIQLAFICILAALFFASKAKAEKNDSYLVKNTENVWVINKAQAVKYVEDYLDYCYGLDDWWSKFKYNKGFDQLDSFKCKYNFRISIYSKQAETFRWLADWSYVDYGLNQESTLKLSREFAKISKEYKLKKESMQSFALNNNHYKQGLDKKSLTNLFLSHLNDKAYFLNLPRWADKK